MQSWCIFWRIFGLMISFSRKTKSVSTYRFTSFKKSFSPVTVFYRHLRGNSRYPFHRRYRSSLPLSLSPSLPLVILLFLFNIYKTSRLRDIVIGTGMTSLCSRPQTTVSHDASFLFHISLLLSWKFCNFFLFYSVDWLNRLFARLQRLAFAFESKLIVLFFFEKKSGELFVSPVNPARTSASSIRLRWLLQLIT